ncbi:MAG: hypothetical protein AB7M12_05780 [Hyphomonadaceae bacterium]
MIDEATLAAVQGNARLTIEELGPLSEMALGFDEASVAWLEGFIERQRERDHDVEGLVSVLGCFLGEAIIAGAGGGVWDQGEHGLGVRFANGDWCFPFAKMEKQFENGAEAGDGILSFYRVAVEQVAKGGL